MQLTIERIEKAVAVEGLSPRALAEYRLYLAALYSLRGAEMQQILKVKPLKWLDMRGEKNSDKATDREWQATPEGQKETHLKWELKRIDRLSSAIAGKLRVMEGEARNQY